MGKLLRLAARPLLTAVLELDPRRFRAAPMWERCKSRQPRRAPRIGAGDGWKSAPEKTGRCAGGRPSMRLRRSRAPQLSTLHFRLRLRCLIDDPLRLLAALQDRLGRSLLRADPVGAAVQPGFVA